MSTTAVSELVGALASRTVEVVDLTQPLSESTPVIELPPPYVNSPGLSRRELARYDARNPLARWDVLEFGEHTGTHLDAPIHWVTGKDKEDVAQVPPRRLVGPAVVLDFAAQAQADPDFLLEVEHIRAWEERHGPLPEGGWLLYRTGWDARSHSQAEYLNADATGPHTPGMSTECARWVAQEAPVAGVGVETVGTDAGAAFGFDPPFPCHSYLLGAGKYGLTQLQNLALLPPTGVVLIAAPLPIVGGSGSPTRVLALVET
jgi:kynurenine formamidase